MPQDKILLVTLVCNFLVAFAFQCAIFALAMNSVIAYIFYHQYRSLNANFGRALGELGRFGGDLASFRRRLR